jgi:hypothetical protein
MSNLLKILGCLLGIGVFYALARLAWYAIMYQMGRK